MGMKGGTGTKCKPQYSERMLNVFDPNFSAPDEKAASRICASQPRRNLQTFGRCLQFKQWHQGNHCNWRVYRSCIALFYRKRLPQQQRDRWIGERETSMHWLYAGQRWVRAIPPYPPPTCDKRRAWVLYSCPPPPFNSTQTSQFLVIFRESG